MTMLAQPCVTLTAQHSNPCSASGFESERLDFEIVVVKWVPERVILAVDVDVWRAVLISNLEFDFLKRG